MGDVYFIKAFKLNRVKIGYTENLEQRLRNLQTSSPVELDLVSWIEDVDRALEAKIHKIFEDDRLHGEWFEITDDLQELMDDPEEFDLDGYAEALDAALLPRYLKLDNKGRWKCCFGKHYGELLDDVIATDYGYIDWMLYKEDFPSSVQEVVAERVRFFQMGHKEETT